MLKGYVSTVLVHATFCPVYLDSRVFAKSAMKLLQWVQLPSISMKCCHEKFCSHSPHSHSSIRLAWQSVCVSHCRFFGLYQHSCQLLICQPHTVKWHSIPFLLICRPPGQERPRFKSLYVIPSLSTPRSLHGGDTGGTRDWFYYVYPMINILFCAKNAVSWWRRNRNIHHIDLFHRNNSVAKLEVAGYRFGDYLGADCTNLPCVRGHNQLTNTTFTKPIT